MWNLTSGKTEKEHLYISLGWTVPFPSLRVIENLFLIAECRNEQELVSDLISYTKLINILPYKLELEGKICTSSMEAQSV